MAYVASAVNTQPVSAAVNVSGSGLSRAFSSA